MMRVYRAGGILMEKNLMILLNFDTFEIEAIAMDGNGNIDNVTNHQNAQYQPMRSINQFQIAN